MAYNTRLEMNNTEAFTTGTDNMTALPDSTKINMATSTQNNGSGQIYVGYFFSRKKKVIASLVNILVMEMLMEHLFIQDLNLRLLLIKTNRHY